MAEILRSRVSWNAERIRERCSSLPGFIREGWPVLEPNNPYVHGWHIDAISEHLEAVSKGYITRLVINEPPGCMKSLVASVMWCAWEWGPFARPDLRYLTTSYQEGYVKRDARKMRDLVSSEWYQALWPIKLIRVAEMSFENTARGAREGKPFKSLTAGRGNRVIIDDPHSTETAESDADRERATRIFRESVPSRINNPKTDAIIVIMHRLHSNDLCGVIDRLGLDYVKLILPMEFEADRRCVTHFGGKKFEDPRAYDGELLFPERFTPEVIERDKKATTSYAWAGQYQQRPAPREGGMFKRQWFEGKIIGQAPAGTVWARHWDLAATAKKTAARTAGVKIGRMPDGRFVVGHVVKTQEEGNAVRKLIKATAETDGKACEISLPQDPGQAGKIQSQDMIAMLAGYKARATPETGDKSTRAEPFAAQCEAGNVSLVLGEWNESYLDELCLAENTQIATMRGMVRIADVLRGDYVATRRGWRRVTEAQLTNEAATLCSIRFNNGSSLSCTLSHPILVPGSNFKKAGHLRAGDRLLRYIEASSSFSGSGQGTPTSSPGSADGKCRSIASFGSRSAAKFLKGIMSTTLMRISGTITSAILNAWARAIIDAIMLNACKPLYAFHVETNFSQNRKSLDRVAALEGAEIAINQRRVTSTYTADNAMSAEPHSSLRTLGNAIVAFDARRLLAGEGVGCSLAPANNVASISHQTPTRADFVDDLAVSDLHILPGKHCVFNLEVEEAHEFVANGILVHNCLFPGGQFKDQVDASSGAFARLAQPQAPRAAVGSFRTTF